MQSGPHYKRRGDCLVLEGPQLRKRWHCELGVHDAQSQCRQSSPWIGKEYTVKEKERTDSNPLESLEMDPVESRHRVRRSHRPEQELEVLGLEARKSDEVLETAMELKEI